MSDIDGFIQGLHEEGVLTSEGRFTISLERAAKARANLLRQSPAWPFLQMIQEAHLQKASQIKVKAGRNELHLGFSCPVQPQWWNAVEWLAQRPVDKPASLLLAEVLLALIASGPAKLELVLVSEYDNAKLTWTPQHEKLALWGMCPQPTQISLTASYARNWWSFAGPSYPSRVGAEVGQRCRHATIPILLDSLQINDADWTTLPGLSYLPPDPTSSGPYVQVAEELTLGGDSRFIAPSTRVLRGLEFQVNGESMRGKSREQCNTLLVSLLTDPKDQVVHYAAVNQFPHDADCLAMHPNVNERGTACLSQQFLVSRNRYHSRSLVRNVGYLDVEKESAPYLEVSSRLVFPNRAPFVGQVCVIHHGVALQVVDCDLGIPGSLALISDPSLFTDAEGCKVVRDATFEKLRRDLALRSKRLAIQLKPWLSETDSITLGQLRPAQRSELEERFSGRR